MRKALLIGAGVVSALLALLIAVIVMQPATTQVQRSKVIAATPEQVWPHVADLQATQAWSPWADLDPDQVVVYSEATSGVGAYYTWQGNDDVGSGKMTITAVEPNQSVVCDLQFIEPFESNAIASTTLEPVEGGTKVTWGFVTDNGFMAKAASMFMDMDAMIGADFEKGLGSLDGVVAADLAAQAQAEQTAAEEAEAEAEATAEGEDAPETEPAP